MARSIDLGKREAWRRRLAAFERQDASVADFCRRASVSVASFYQWRRKLAAEDRGQRNGRPRSGQAGNGMGLHFVPVEVLGRLPVEVRLKDGTQILIPGQDHQAIRSVLGMLLADR